MILVKKKNINLIFIVFISIIIFSAFSLYIIINTTDFSDSINVKIMSETIIFVSIVLTFFLVLFYSLLLKTNKNVLDKLDDLIDVLKDKDIDHLDDLRFYTELGILGIKIKRLLITIQDLSIKRKIKISSFYKIITTLLESTDYPLGIIQADGKIILSNDKFRKYFKIKDLNNIKFNNFFKVNFMEIFLELEELNASVTKKNVQIVNSKQVINNLNFIPIINSTGLLSHIIYYWDK